MFRPSATVPVPSPLIVSIPRARKLLGPEWASLSDEKVKQLILDYDELATASVASYRVQKSSQHLDS
jgi:hypothetical protein